MLVRELIEELNNINPEIEVTIDGREIENIIVYDDDLDTDDTDCVLVSWAYS